MTISEGLKEIGKILSGVQDERKENEEVLTEEILHHLWLMTPKQLSAIYKNGKRPVRIDDDPDAYRKLALMSPEQLKAIFGDDAPN